MSLLAFLLKRLRPAVGWPVALLALGAVLTPAIAATSGNMALPTSPISWAGAIGLALGADLSRPTRSRLWRAVRAVAAALLIVCGGATILIAAGQAMPPLGLIVQDAAATIDLAMGRAQASGAAGMSVRFLGEALPRLWQAILAAPNAGQTGARLITLVVSTTGTWIGAIILGWAVAARRSTFSWGMPILAATATTAILGGGSGAGLLFGIALILMLTVVTHMAGLRRDWDRQHTDYTDEIAPQVIAMGGLMVALALVGALAIPTSPPLWLTAWLWHDVPLPSGIAAIEAQVQRPRPASVIVGLSQLPSLSLGSSLQQGPDEQPALRVSVGAQLPASPWPRYWRARVLDRYTGHSWATSARVGAPLAYLTADAALPIGVAQTVEDLRPFRLTLVGLADILAANVDAQAERLPDGSLAALSVDPAPAGYRIFSLPQELATTPLPTAPPPDMGTALSLPAALPARVRELAHTVAGDAASPYDKALAIERYLRALPYSYQVAPLSPDRDAVDQFLFEMRQGYCTYYASAMAIMARSLGIPARLAVGYATGSYDAADGRYLVREADAHAWPELYINGRWLPFEPTPIRPLPPRGGPTAPAPTAIPAPEQVPPATVGLLAPWVIGAALALAALVGTWLIWRRQTVPPLARALLRLERRGAHAGIPWPAGATLREYARLLAPYTPATNLLADLITQVDAATYGKESLARNQESLLARDLDALSATIQKHSQHTH